MITKMSDVFLKTTKIMFTYNLYLTLIIVDTKIVEPKKKNIATKLDTCTCLRILCCRFNN